MSRAPKSTSGLPGKKIALLHVAKRDLHLSDDDYRAMLVQVAGVASATELDLLGFERVIAHLTRLGFKSTWSKRTFGNRAGMASPSQVDLIRKLWGEYHHQGNDETAEAALNTWLTRYHHVSALRFVTAEIAGRIIPGLKAMAARNQHGR
ncbi:hypothetical protein ASD04_17810 [Devosia sp. Root436]|uniref:regulatory protein GemA n=1 Tax=Devosia sp. Root436 TaxID=1736537 RepID=UPI0006FC4EBE|nr:regulatory protein GemA [Devosia sp. Root436]KQX34097.1 hypothetical protein ASD04_17810 [Devosia sp. Root436]